MRNEWGYRTALEEVNATHRLKQVAMATSAGISAAEAATMIAIDDEGNIRFTEAYEKKYNSLLGNETALNAFTEGMDNYKTLQSEIIDNEKSFTES